MKVFEIVKNTFKNISRTHYIHENSLKLSRVHLRTVQEDQSQHIIQKSHKNVQEQYIKNQEHHKFFKRF